MKHALMLIATVCIVCAPAVLTDNAWALVGSTTPSTGGACHVISGANKGKSGTYNADGDCEGAWGMSECKNSNGTDSGKCAVGKETATPGKPKVTIPAASGGATKASP